MDGPRKKLKTEHTGKCWLEALMPAHLTTDIPLKTVWIARIKNKKVTSELIVRLNKVHPVPDLLHLKRVRGDHVLLDGFTDLTAFLKKLAESGLDLDDYLTDFKQIQVFSVAPKLRTQFEVGNKLWPCNFHEDKVLEKLISGSYWKDSQLKSIAKYLKRALELQGAVIVDPETNHVIAEGEDKRESHPLQHSVMLAIDAAARGQGGGAWPESSELLHMNQSPSAYLCTGYDIYCAREPCTMCSMALVHSRIKRIFYVKDSLNGALSSRFQLHSLKALNHHYLVFRGTPPDLDF